MIPNHPTYLRICVTCNPLLPVWSSVLFVAPNRPSDGKNKESLLALLPAPRPPVLHADKDFYPDYPEDWIDVTEEASEDYLLPTHVSIVASRTTYALAEATRAVLQNTPNNIKQTFLAIRDLSTDLDEHAPTVHDI